MIADVELHKLLFISTEDSSDSEILKCNDISSNNRFHTMDIFIIIYLFIRLKLYIQIITFYIQIPFLCRVTAGTRHMKGGTVAESESSPPLPPS